MPKSRSDGGSAEISLPAWWTVPGGLNIQVPQWRAEKWSCHSRTGPGSTRIPLQKPRATHHPAQQNHRTFFGAGQSAERALKVASVGGLLLVHARGPYWQRIVERSTVGDIAYRKKKWPDQRNRSDRI